MTFHVTMNKEKGIDWKCFKPLNENTQEMLPLDCMLMAEDVAFGIELPLCLAILQDTAFIVTWQRRAAQQWGIQSFLQFYTIAEWWH